MRRAVVALVAVLLAGCGGAKRTPCSGAACLNVAGNYNVQASSPPSGNTCKNIVYVVSGDANGAFQAPFTLTQNGSSLEFNFEGNVGIQVQGTLFTDNTASFSQHIPHLEIVSPTDGTTWDYADDTAIDLTFTKGGDGTIKVSGTMRDALVANSTGVPDDSSCTLEASLTSD
ncbi:MAG: hypothetical protein JST54_28585 [Deltaproteobacteria bacterium]|nr:hypothetical protein [Deltaproteobacteria bacterium]